MLHFEDRDRPCHYSQWPDAHPRVWHMLKTARVKIGIKEIKAVRALDRVGLCFYFKDNFASSSDKDPD